MDNNERKIFLTMLEISAKHLNDAREELERLEAITEFDTLEEYNTFKADRKDTEEKESIFLSLISILKDAEEFLDYERALKGGLMKW